MRGPRRLLRLELTLLRALVLLALRRVDGARADDVQLPYARGHRTTAVLVLGLSAVELVAVELVVPWPLARRVLLLLGAWTLLVVAGLVALEITRPHLVRPGEVVVRHGGGFQVLLASSAVARVERRPRHDRGERAVVDEAGSLRLHLPVAGSTAIDLVLAEPVPVRLRRREALVTRVSIAVDDPSSALEALRRQIDVKLPSGEHEVNGRWTDDDDQRRAVRRMDG